MTTPDLPDDPGPDLDRSPNAMRLREQLLSNVIASLVPEMKAVLEFQDERSESRLALLEVDDTGRAGTILFHEDEPPVPFELTVVDGEPAITADWPDGNRPISILKCLVPQPSRSGTWKVQLPPKSRPLTAWQQGSAEQDLSRRTVAAPVLGAMRAHGVDAGGLGPLPTISADGTLTIPRCPDIGDDETDEALLIVEVTVGRQTTKLPFIAKRANKSPHLSAALPAFRDRFSEFATEATITVRSLKPEDWLNLPAPLVELALETAQLDNRSLMTTSAPGGFAFVSNPTPFFKSDNATETTWLVRYLPNAAPVEGAQN